MLRNDRGILPASGTKILRRILFRAVVVFLGFTIFFPVLYVAVVRESRGTEITLSEPPARSYSVYVVDWGYHTAIVVEQPSDWSLGPPGQERAPFLEYAWGDRSFYLYGDYRPHILYATLVLPTASVLYLGGYSAPAFPGARAVYARTVDANTLRALVLTLERSIQRDSNSARVAPYAHGNGFPGRFFPAHGKYLWPRDCNWWTVARLQEIGLAGSPLGVLFSGQVSGRLIGFHRAISP